MNLSMTVSRYKTGFTCPLINKLLVIQFDLLSLSATSAICIHTLSSNDVSHSKTESLFVRLVSSPNFLDTILNRWVNEVNEAVCADSFRPCHQFQ